MNNARLFFKALRRGWTAQSWRFPAAEKEPDHPRLSACNAPSCILSMNSEDERISRAELRADPRLHSGHDDHRQEHHHQEYEYEPKQEQAFEHEHERPPSPWTRSSTDSYSSSVNHGHSPRLQALHSRATEPDLERQRTTASQAQSRIETRRIQHALTVGGGSESIKSRPSTKAAAPLPPFGHGKAYPPPLPAREDYVVEFDGPGDPTYPQNWPLNRK